MGRHILDLFFSLIFYELIFIQVNVIVFLDFLDMIVKKTHIHMDNILYLVEILKFAHRNNSSLFFFFSPKEV